METNEIVPFLRDLGGKVHRTNDSERENRIKRGKTAKGQFYELSHKVGEDLSLECNVKGGKNWQNSGNIAKYFWTEFKSQSRVNSPISLSLFAEKLDSGVQFRVSVEIDNASASQQDTEVYKKLLDRPLKSGLVYVNGGNNESFEILDETDNSKVKACKYTKVQVSKLIDGSLNGEVLISEIEDGLKELMPYYDYVFSENEIGDEWWPSFSEYSPSISKEKWLELLNDDSIFSENAYNALAAMYDFGGEATCKQLELKYGESSFFYRNAMGTKLAEKIRTKLDLSYCNNPDGRAQVWPILFQGRKAKSDENGEYVWKMRPELFEALKEFDISRYLLTNGERRKMEITTNEAIDKIKSYIADKGYVYDESLINNFYLCLKSKPFVILAGTSGTGKTKLVELFAEAISAEYKLIPVRPDWSDSSDLFGYVNLNGEFIPGAMLEFIKQASENKDTPYIVCLDEMNLARVEYYLSDFLSIIETRKFKDGSITTIPIISEEKFISCSSESTSFENYGNMSWPENLYLVGTVNMDETTFPFSKKVLDRANTIEFSEVDLNQGIDEVYTGNEQDALELPNAFLKTGYLILKDCEDKEFVRNISEILQNINDVLKENNAHVGYRVRDEISFYMLNNKKAELMEEDAAMDFEIMQKILPRIQGSNMATKKMLCDLFSICIGGNTEDYNPNATDIADQMDKDLAECRYKKSAKKIVFMIRRFEEDGFTSYWL